MASEVVWHHLPLLPLPLFTWPHQDLFPSAPGMCHSCSGPRVFALAIPLAYKALVISSQVCLLLILWVSAQMLPPSGRLHHSLLSELSRLPEAYLSPVTFHHDFVDYHCLCLWVYLISLFAFLFTYLWFISPDTSREQRLCLSSLPPRPVQRVVPGTWHRLKYLLSKPVFTPRIWYQPS